MIITFEGADKLFKYIDDTFELLPERMVIEATDDLYENAKKRVRRHTKTGRMENNLTQRVNKRALEGEVYISDDGMLTDWNGKPTNYALFVHFGSKPHVIEPKKKKALRWSSVNGFVYAKKINHPGYRGDPFMYDASRETFNNLDTIFKRVYNGLQ